MTFNQLLPFIQSANQKIEKFGPLDPAFSARMGVLIGFCDAFGYPLSPTSGFRSLSKQTALHRAGYPTAKRSWHTEGKGMDVSGSKSALQFAGKVAPYLGLRWGGNFSTPDDIHFDYPIGNEPKPAYT